jgi:hypothetical protein
MTDHWQPKETSTHQDHVIAHVLGATVLGYFVFDEALHLLLDIGLVWTIYVDGQMMLLPQVVAINELETDAATKSELNREIELLGQEGRLAEGLERLTPAPAEFLIAAVNFFEDGNQRRLILTGEKANLMIETSLETAEIQVSADDQWPTQQ